MCATVVERTQSAKEALRLAAKRLFAERGFDGVSVKEVAQATGHNPALINYHFGGKEGLYRECVLPIVGIGLVTMKRTLRAASCQQDFLTRFTLFEEEFIANCMGDPEACLILKRDSNTEVVKKLYRGYLVPIFECMYKFLRSAKRANILRRDLDTEVATHIIFGSVFDLIALDRLRAGVGDRCFLDDKHCAATVRQLTQFMLAGMLAPEDPCAP